VPLEASKGMTYSPYSLRKPESYRRLDRIPSTGTAAGGMAGSFRGPYIPFNGQRTDHHYSLPKPQMTNPIQDSAQPSMNNSRGSSGGGSYTQAQVLGIYKAH